MTYEYFEITISVNIQNEEALRDACARNGVLVISDSGPVAELGVETFSLKSQSMTGLFLAGAEYGRLTNTES